MASTGITQRHGTNCKGGRKCGCPWLATVDLPDRKKRRKTHKTERDARDWQTLTRADVKRGKVRHTPAGQPTVAQAAEEFLDGAREGTIPNASGRAFKPATLRGYERGLRLRVLPAIGAKKLGAVTRRDVQGIVNRMQGGGAASSTVSNTIDALRTVYRLAIEDDVVSSSPTERLRLRRTEKAPPRIAEPAEARALLDAMPEIEDRALWATALYAGLRRGELRALRWSDVDLDAGEIHVRRAWDDKQGEQAPKSKAGTRTVPIFDTLAPLLAALKGRTGRGGFDLVFGDAPEEPFQPAAVNRRAQRAWETAGLERIGLHECRHTFASVAIYARVDLKRIQAYMGHASLAMTVDTYGHLLKTGEEEARAAMNAFLAEERPALRAV